VADWITSVVVEHRLGSGLRMILARASSPLLRAAGRLSSMTRALSSSPSIAANLPGGAGCAALPDHLVLCMKS
jgi:hypothetical protein